MSLSRFGFACWLLLASMLIAGCGSRAQDFYPAESKIAKPIFSGQGACLLVLQAKGSQPRSLQLATWSIEPGGDEAVVSPTGSRREIGNAAIVSHSDNYCAVLRNSRLSIVTLSNAMTTRMVVGNFGKEYLAGMFDRSGERLFIGTRNTGGFLVDAASAKVVRRWPGTWQAIAFSDDGSQVLVKDPYNADKVNTLEISKSSKVEYSRRVPATETEDSFGFVGNWMSGDGEKAGPFAYIETGTLFYPTNEEVGFWSQHEQTHRIYVGNKHGFRSFDTFPSDDSSDFPSYLPLNSDLMLLGMTPNLTLAYFGDNAHQGIALAVLNIWTGKHQVFPLRRKGIEEILFHKQFEAK
ncbi:MAG: hypothetical protein JNJ45_06625 [Chthonomonas sp.]|nr:hypothetical protein [Chthonomonas sp.]